MTFDYMLLALFW